MVIAINTIIVGEDRLNQQHEFISQIFSRIIKQQPQHTFIIISENNNSAFTSFKNVIHEITFPKRKNLLQWYAWYRFKIPAILKKYKADIFISPGAIAFTSVKTIQCLLATDLSFIHESKYIDKKELGFYKKLFPGSLKKATSVFTVSEFCKQDVINEYKIGAEKINVIYEGLNENLEPVNFKCKEEVKSKYTNGNEYFIYTGIIDESKNLVNVLKAFSAFKKRQKSNMQLILAGKPGLKFNDFNKVVISFKFKNDVKIFTDLSFDELIKLIASSYAFIYVAYYEGFPLQALQAMKCNVPVIASSTSSMPEICSGAALYANPENFKEIAIQMMQVFRDENLRDTLIKKGAEQQNKFSWDITSQLLWDHIENSFKNIF